MQLAMLTALGVGGATIFGVLIGFLFQKVPHKFNDAILGFAAGIMLAAAVLGLIVPSLEEGIIFDLLTNPIEILTDENEDVVGMKCVKMELGEPDASGRRRPVVIEGSEFEMELDTVIMSLGTSPNPLISSTTEGLEVNRWKCIVADEATGKTTKEGVYAGGDAVTGAATVILAMGAGKAGAKGIHEYLSNK